MIVTFLRLIAMLAASAAAGILGVIWLFGEHSSIWVTVGVKPFGLLLLLISLILFEHTKREVSEIEKRDNRH